MDEYEWRIESSQLKLDVSDDIYQNSANDIDARDRGIAIKRMKLSGFSCEFDSSHALFLSRFSKKPYVEVHHLVAISTLASKRPVLDEYSLKLPELFSLYAVEKIE